MEDPDLYRVEDADGTVLLETYDPEMAKVCLRDTEQARTVVYGPTGEVLWSRA